MKPVRFHLAAEQELEEAIAWYRARSVVAGQAFELEFEAALRQIAENPERWASEDPGTRRFRLKRFPYTILYRIRQTHIFVTAVAHKRQRPRYWSGRG